MITRRGEVRVDVVDAVGVVEAQLTPAGVGEQIRQFRLAAGLTQLELARRTGSTQPAVAHLEAGHRIPTLATLEKLARALGQDLVVVLPCDVAEQASA